MKPALPRPLIAALLLASGLTLVAACSRTAATAGGTTEGERPYWAGDPKLETVDGYGPQVVHGRQVFAKWCAPCHAAGSGRYGRGLTGTESLEAKYKGKIPPILSERTDLTPDLVSYFVRNGNTSMMPFFRKTEISDEDLTALGAYLSRLNPDLQTPKTAAPGKEKH